MATAQITNLSQCLISVTGPVVMKDLGPRGQIAEQLFQPIGLEPRTDKNGKINKDSSKPVDDKLAKHWAGREGPARMIQQGTVTVEYMVKARVSEPPLERLDKELAAESKSEGETKDVTKMHHRALAVRIPKMTNLDELERLAGDERKSVSEAAYKRMDELED